MAYGPDLEHVWLLDTEHYSPEVEEPTFTTRKSATSLLAMEEMIANQLSDTNAEISRAVHFFDGRDFHLAGGSKITFQWRLHILNRSQHCMDCGTDTSDEYYMVADDLWNRATYPDWDGLLCIGCLEARIGKTLVATDFQDLPINTKPADRSARLSDRLLRHDA